MNKNVSIDVDYLEALPVRTLLHLEDTRRKAQAALEKCAETLKEAAPLFVILEGLDIDVFIDMRTPSIDIGFTGNADKLVGVWRLLRRAGYKADSNPGKADQQFVTFWRHPKLITIFMRFCSSVCRRKQVGTRMAEVPVYETVCEELPELSNEAHANDLIPF